MSAAPIYLSQGTAQNLDQAPQSQINAGQLTTQSAQQFGQAAGGLGQSVLGLAAAVQHVNRASTLADRQTSFLTGIDKLQQEFQNDADPTTAPQRFQERASQLQSEALRGLPQEDSAELNLKLTRQSVSYSGAVRADALKKQADGYTAGLDKQYETLTRRYAQAGSDAERNALASELDDTLAKGVNDGMTTAKSAEAYRQSLRKTGDSAVILRQIANNPAAAQAALADPAQFAGLDPVQREQLTAQAKAAADDMEIQRRTNLAKFNPAQAAFQNGRITDPKQAELIFDKAIIPQESGGQAGAVSKKGALGIGQVMPDTARGVAEKHSINDIVALTDEELKARLTSDPALGRRLGLLYFQDNLRTFNGNLAPTIAAYHAGPNGNVAKAAQAASAKYGENYSADQFLEFLPATLTDGDKTTADYVRDIYKRMGATTQGGGLTGMANYRAANAVGSVLDSQRAESDRILSAQVAVAGRQSDEFVSLFEKGYLVNPERLTPVRAMLELGVSRGDTTEADHLRRLNEAQSVAPIVREAYGMRPEALEASTAQMRQQLALGGDATPAMAKRLKIFEAVQTEMANARRDNPIALAERQGMPATPIDIQGQPGDPAFAQQLAARGIVSARAQAAYGGEHQFFRPEERVAAKARFEAMGEDERFGLLKSLQESTPNEAVYRAAVKELTGGDKLAATAGMFMTTNPTLAKDIFRGSAILQLDGIKPKTDDLRNALKTVMPGLIYPSTVQSDLIEAGLAVYAAKRGKNAALYDAADRSGLEDAMEAVMGKMATINGQKTPMPMSVSKAEAQDLFGWRVGNLTQEALDAAGGAADRDGKPLDVSLIRAHARLIPADGRVGDHQKFRVVFAQGNEERPVMMKDGKTPLTIDLPKLITANRIIRDSADTKARAADFQSMVQQGIAPSYSAPTD